MTLSVRPPQVNAHSLGPIDIFGRSTMVFVDASTAGRLLLDELSMYRRSDGPTTHAVSVTHTPAPDGLRLNPALHAALDDGFVARYPNAAIRYRFDADGSVATTVHLPPPLGRLSAWRSRWRSVQFSTTDEAIGQIVHELALVPMLYFDPERAPIHASAFSVPGVGMILVGGTGGVGKTTLALDLCHGAGAAFAADDIAVLDATGAVHPNLAYPKIYAYNVSGDASLEARLHGEASMVDRLQWRWRERRAGPSKVRRRMSPLRLYGSVIDTPQPLRRYLMIVREHRAAVMIESARPQRVAEMSASVLAAEYDAWHRHLAWHAFDALAVGQEPRLRLEDWFHGYRAMLARTFDGVECLVARVPIRMPHDLFRRELVALVRQP